MKIGVLALQGDFIEHIKVLKGLGAKPMQVRKPEELKGLDGLIIPGGESTAIANLMHSSGLFAPLKKLAQAGLPVMGTCAGMALMAKKISDSNMDTLALMDMEVRRNAFGRQMASFETELHVPAIGEKPFPSVFIRAPLISSVAPQVEILARLISGAIVTARQGSKLAIAFHPELTSDPRLHNYFLQIVACHRLTTKAGTQSKEKKPSRKAPIPAD